MFTILRTLNIAGLGGGLVSAAVFDDRLSGLPRLALFAALAVLDLILIIWITRNPATSTADNRGQAPQAELEQPRSVLAPNVVGADEVEFARQAA